MSEAANTGTEPAVRPRAARRVAAATTNPEGKDERRGRKPVYLVDGARTPFLRARGKPGPFTPVDLAVQCGRPLLDRLSFGPEEFDLVILGCVNVLADEMNPARVAALRLGMGEAMRAFTVQINCGSGMQSIDTGFRLIEGGEADLILAGGAEALSHAPLVLSRKAAGWFAQFATAKTAWDRAAALGAFRPDMAKPIIGLERGLTDPITDFSMGQTAEIIGHAFGVTRQAADAYALESHRRLARAQAEGFLKGEVIASVAADGTLYDHDDGVRPDSSIEKLARLKPVFERPHGRVTPGNSSQITDGASWVVIASEEAIEKYGLTPIARIVDSEWAALDPSVMGLGPTICSTELIKRRGLAREDIDLWEINEAFAAQILACLAAWEDEEYCREVLGLSVPFGTVDRDRLNVDGGAISLGHPVGSSGNRIVLHLANAMRRLGLKRGIATECIGGGQGGAMLLEVV
ncbi:MULTISPECIES: acetyl-CoA C-acetyltransferase [Chelativorans]|jgi:acetyl-CoA C-acetyltransferase|uniref:Acetyl-CoA acetyltransferase n=1 Tax=Chelativorans sp. (strain BNC1) TaxID=266779 RepID=Q11I56_CHESB|nr:MULTISPECIES: acetyl-CoA C-acetyltransferase [Chelativorans]